MEDQAAHIVGKVDEHDLGFGTLDADGAKVPGTEFRGHNTKLFVIVASTS
jgi:hypothetical protein